jgi:hypothetical protein
MKKTRGRKSGETIPLRRNTRAMRGDQAKGSRGYEKQVEMWKNKILDVFYKQDSLLLY